MLTWLLPHKSSQLPSRGVVERVEIDDRPNQDELVVEDGCKGGTSRVVATRGPCDRFGGGPKICPPPVDVALEDKRLDPFAFARFQERIRIFLAGGCEPGH